MTMHPQQRPCRWAIIGGGMLGMTLAHDLAQRGNRVSLFEAAPQLGGLASPWHFADFVWDRHYHVTLLSDSAFRGLLQELDLDREMVWSKTRTGYFADNRLFSVSNAAEFLRFPVLGMIDKARLAWTILYVSRLRSLEQLEGVTLSDWLIRTSGRRVYERFWSPLLRSKLGDDYASVAASFLGATIQRLYAARRSGLKEEMFGYLPGGYDRILKTFVERLCAEGVSISVHRPAAAVESIAGPDGPEVRIRFADDSIEIFDRVALTVPGSLAEGLCPALTDEEKKRLRGIQYQGILCASVLLQRPLSPFYVTNLSDSSLPFTGVIEMTALVDRGMFGGNTLVYLPRYLRPDDPAFHLSDDQIRTQFLGGLRQMHPDLRPDDVLAFQVSRVRHVFARPTLHYSKSLPPIDTSVPGVHIVNSAHITNGTLNVNETVLLARQQAERLHQLALAGSAAPVETPDQDPVYASR